MSAAAPRLAVAGPRERDALDRAGARGFERCRADRRAARRRRGSLRRSLAGEQQRGAGARGERVRQGDGGRVGGGVEAGGGLFGDRHVGGLQCGIGEGGPDERALGGHDVGKLGAAGGVEDGGDARLGPACRPG